MERNPSAIDGIGLRVLGGFRVRCLLGVPVRCLHDALGAPTGSLPGPGPFPGRGLFPGLRKPFSAPCWDLPLPSAWMAFSQVTLGAAPTTKVFTLYHSMIALGSQLEVGVVEGSGCRWTDFNNISPFQNSQPIRDQSLPSVFQKVWIGLGVCQPHHQWPLSVSWSSTMYQ